jgi:hypothetical protein
VTTTVEDIEEDTIIKVEAFGREDTDWTHDDKSIITIDVKMIFFFIH